MREKLRKSGIDVIGDVPWGTHFCQFYQTKEDLMDILVPYFKAGLENNELCIWVTSQPLEVEEAKEALRIAVPDIDVYLEKGQIEIISYTRWYANESVGNNFDSERGINRWVEKLNKALTSGYNGLRLTEDTSWLKKENWNDFVDFEEKLDNIVGNYQIMALCTYSLDRCNTAEIINVIINNQLALVKEKGRREQVESSNRQNITKRKQLEKALCQSQQRIRPKLENSLSPARRVEKLELADIIDAQAIQSLMDDFYKLVHIPMGLNDLKGNVLVGVGWQDICTRFHRVHPEACKHCVESNIKLSSGVSPGEFKMYKCKNNMWDIVTPIMVGDQHIGDIFAGQFFFEDEPLDYELFRSQARRYGFNEDEYIAALEKVPRLSRDAVDTGMAFFMTFANMLSQLSYSNIKLAQSLAEHDALVDALQESEKRERVHSDELVAVLDSMPAAVWIAHDPQALYITGNRFSYEWLRIPMGTNLSKSAPEGERPEMFRLFKDGVEIPPVDMPLQMSAAGAELNNYEIDVMFSDGEIRHLLGNARPLHDEQGNPRGSVSAFIDITERKRAEEALRLSNIYNRSLIEASLDPLVTIGPDGKITDVNGATELATGHSRNELIGTDFSDYFTEPEKARKGYQQVFTNGEVRDYPLEIQHKNGCITPVLYNASVYKNEAGKVIGVFAAARDITELKKAEKALKKAHDNLEENVKARTSELEEAYNSLMEKERRLSEAQRIAHLGNWDRDLVTNKLYWSDEMYRIFGLRPQEFEVTYDIFLNHYAHPDDRKYVNDAVKGAFNGKPFDIDYRIILDNGVERIVHGQGEVIFDPDNIPVQVRGTVQDITERKKAEEKIQSLANIVESSNDGIITESLDGIITNWNKGAEQIYGYSAKEILGKPISILEPLHLNEETKKLAELVQQGERIQQYETLRLRKDGTVINVSITLSPIFDASGKLTAVSVIYRDITKRKEAEEALEKVQEAHIKEIHHRIKNNLQVISSLLSLEAEKFSDVKMLESFRESQNRVASMALIHEELYKGNELDTLDFATYLQKLTADLFDSYNLRNNDVSLKLDLEKIHLGMDIAIPLGIIVNELISNSLKHAFPAGKEGEIHIGLHKTEIFAANYEIPYPGPSCMEKNGFHYILTVADNGKGIPEKIEFPNTDSLGLQLVNILVEQIDGCVELKRNKGTEFTIWFSNIET